jgi:hypothetical protein
MDKMTEAVEKVISDCKHRARTDFMECGLKKNLRVVTNFYSKKPVPMLLRGPTKPPDIPVFGKIADTWPHAKERAERDAEAEKVAIEAQIGEAWELPWVDDIAFTPDLCGYRARCSAIMRNDGFKVVGKVEGSDELEIEIPNPIRILVSKKGHVTLVDSE